MFVPRNWRERLSPREIGVPMLFVHTPKCGGSFVWTHFETCRKRCVSLSEPVLAGHLTWQDYHDRLPLLGQSIEDYTTFSVIRNPFDWHVSWFNYIRKPKGGKRSGYHLEHLLFQKMSFADYVEWLDDPDRKMSRLFDMGCPISDWVTNTRGEIAVDHLLRQENLAADLSGFLAQYGLPQSISQKRVNRSNSKDFREFYTTREVDIVARRHARDLELFGYSFE